MPDTSNEDEFPRDPPSDDPISGSAESVEGAGGRRRLITHGHFALMSAGLAAGYGMFGYIAGKFLYPLERTTDAWMFVCEVSALSKGDSIKYQTPNGEKINVTRMGTTDAVESFIALSSTCPHLGCQVHWEAKKGRFFCPCHNGTFAPDGTATGGPPGDAKQRLEQKALKIKSGLLYMFVDTKKLADAGVLDDSDDIRGSGHDPCLARREPKVG